MASHWAGGPIETVDASLTADTLADHPDLARLRSALQAPQAAIRARLNAVVLDLILLGLVSQVLAKAVAPGAGSSTRALVFLAVQFAYFFIWELRSGQTIGKRIFHVRVTSTTGAPVTARQVALRNVLRVVDALPFFYASGLISLIRTGPGRRQRIGDVAAGTTVILDAHGKPLRTPRWLLPALTILTTLLSIAIIVPILKAPRTTLPAAGGPPGLDRPPLDGVWVASGQTISSVGYGNDPQPSARWTIGRNCPPEGLCGLSLTYEAAGERTVHARLLPASSGWVAVFPNLTFPCGQAAGETLYWQQRTAIALRFTDGGRAAEGEERDFSQSPRCGYGTALRRWTARLAKP
jgi:uncharacterized RDD family membrane protein YckC